MSGSTAHSPAGPSQNQNPNPTPKVLPIDPRGLSALLIKCPAEGPDSDHPGRPYGPRLGRCREKGCFNMLLWTTDDFNTGLPVAAVCGHCGKSVKYPPRAPGAGKVWIDILDHGQIKAYLVRMLQWELDTMPWGRNGAEHDAAISTVYQSFIDNYDVADGLFKAFKLADEEWKRQGCPAPFREYRTN